VSNLRPAIVLFPLRVTAVRPAPVLSKTAICVVAGLAFPVQLVPVFQLALELPSQTIPACANRRQQVVATISGGEVVPASVAMPQPER